MFFSASSTGDFQQLWDFGIREILVSYFYIRKNPKYYDKMLPLLKAAGGVFMTDSGAFSFMAKFHEGTPEFSEMSKPEFWENYLNEYVDWVKEHKDLIFSCANLDLDTILGYDVIDKWNREKFYPLEKEFGLQVVYVVHEDREGGAFVSRLKEYAYLHTYIGVNQVLKNYSKSIFQVAKDYSVRVHGFAWTEIGLLRHEPFFSVDSVSWLGGVRFGTTFKYDGKNFSILDYKNKTRRKAMKNHLIEQGVDWDGVQKEKRIPINQMNLLGWLGFRKEYLKMANLKLWNNSVSTYERKH